MSQTQLAQSTARLMMDVCAAMKLRSIELPDTSSMTLLQIRALTFIGRAPRTVGDLGRHLGSTIGSASSLVDRLVKKGYVRRMRDPANRRVVNSILTREGRHLIQRFWSPRVTAKDLQDLLGEEELAIVAEAMRILGNSIRR